jgi:DNA-binding transcriptional MerR regulator/methylmalonyl-CoA mutase cobalamin-binding subunit
MFAEIPHWESIKQTMYTIKQTAGLSGVPESSLRAWERRYGVVAPRRTQTGYRLYDDEAVAAVTTMRRLVEAGWSASLAAAAVREGTAEQSLASAASTTTAMTQTDARTNAPELMSMFLSAAARLDTLGIERSLDRGFSLGSFEHVADSWLFPTLEALGEGWARGEIDVAGEHAASHAVHRRLAAAFQAAGSVTGRKPVVVGLPPGSHHELGALAFATALRRRGRAVVYLGDDVPVGSWDTAITATSARAAVLGVVMAQDRPQAAAVARTLSANHPDLHLASGGGAGSHLSEGVQSLPLTISSAAEQLDDLLPV